MTFGEFMEQLTKHMKKYQEDAGKVDDTISMASLLNQKPPDEADGPLPSDEEDFLKLHNSEYLRAREAGEKP